MKIETLVGAVQRDLETLRAIQRYITSYPEAFELLDFCTVYQAGGAWTIYCHPPEGAAPAFARLLGPCAWTRQLSDKHRFSGYDWKGRPEGLPAELHVFAAEAQDIEREVRL